MKKRVSVGRSSQPQATLPGGLVAKEGHGDERIRWRRTDGDGAGTGRNKSMRRRAILREAILKSCASTEERLLVKTHTCLIQFGAGSPGAGAFAP